LFIGKAERTAKPSQGERRVTIIRIVNGLNSFVSVFMVYPCAIRIKGVEKLVNIPTVKMLFEFVIVRNS
jgi:hypothetical protein